MMKRGRMVSGALMALILLANCRNPVDIHRPGDFNHAGFNFSGAFESFWNGMNMYYVFWDVEPLHYWDTVWDTYKPRFSSLQSRLEGGENAYTLLAEAHRYFGEFLAPLADGHLFVFFDFGLPRISPGLDRVDARFSGLAANNNPRRAFFASTWSGVPFTANPDYTNYNFWEYTIRNYVTINARSFPFNPGPIPAYVEPGSVFRAATGRIPYSGGGFILYFYSSAFLLLEYAAYEYDAYRIIMQYLNDIASPDLRGVIIDLRGNTGGYTEEINMLLDRLVHERLHFAYIRYKSGLNRLDLTPWIPYYITPHPNPAERVQNDVPVVALIDDFSISCGELAPMAISRMPRGYLIGTRSFGATGPRFSDFSPALLNGGSFLNLSGNTLWNQVVLAGFQTRSAAHRSYEGVGIPPNLTIAFDWAEFYGDGNGSGRDRQLLAAIRHIDPAYTGP